MPTLPGKARALTISTFDARLDPLATSCDLRNLLFTDAYGLVGTACALRAGLSDSPSLRVLPPVNRSTSAHLTSMGFREFLQEHFLSPTLPDRPAADVSGVVVPLRSAQAAGGDQALSALLWEQLRAYVDPQVLEAVVEGVWEIVANTFEHSGSDAHVMAQVYREAGGGTRGANDRPKRRRSGRYRPSWQEGSEGSADTRCHRGAQSAAVPWDIPMMRVKTPNHAGSRDQAKTLAATLPSDLEGQTVLLDCSGLVVGAPSFLDEMVKQILVLRQADALEVSGAPNRARDLLERAAQNRSVREQLRVAARIA